MQIRRLHQYLWSFFSRKYTSSEGLMARCEGGQEGEWTLWSHPELAVGHPVDTCATPAPLDSSQEGDCGLCTPNWLDESQGCWAINDRGAIAPPTPPFHDDVCCSPTERPPSSKLRDMTFDVGHYDLPGEEKEEHTMDFLHDRKQAEYGTVAGRSASIAKTVPCAIHCSANQHVPEVLYPKSRPTLLIQVAPGLVAPLRRVEETWESIQDDFYVPHFCAICDTTLFVIQDAAFVLCPDCRTVSKVEGNFVDPIAAGVGTGFSHNDLIQWQREIVVGRDLLEDRF